MSRRSIRFPRGSCTTRYGWTGPPQSLRITQTNGLSGSSWRGSSSRPSTRLLPLECSSYYFFLKNFLEWIWPLVPPTTFFFLTDQVVHLFIKLCRWSFNIISIEDEEQRLFFCGVSSVSLPLQFIECLFFNRFLLLNLFNSFSRGYASFYPYEDPALRASDRVALPSMSSYELDNLVHLAKDIVVGKRKLENDLVRQGMYTDMSKRTAVTRHQAVTTTFNKANDLACQQDLFEEMTRLVVKKWVLFMSN